MEIQNLAHGWHTPPDTLDLPENTVHLWSVDLGLASDNLEAIGKTLANDEWARAARIRSPFEQKSFIAARGALRNVLSRYVRCAPLEVDLSYGSYGKPQLRPCCHSSHLQFNITHAESLGLFAVAQGGEVGIDVERIKPCEDFERIAERFFSPPEIQALQAIPPNFRRFAFLAYWTRKEAFTKALGAGLQMDWTSFAVSLLPAQTVHSANPSGTRWSIFSFLPAFGYVAALACQGDGPTLKFWKWSPVPSVSPSTQLPKTGRPASGLAMRSVSREEVCV